MTGSSALAERHIAAADGTELLMRDWPAPADAVAHVLILHGLAEHSGRYEHVAGWLAAGGFAAHAFDLRGFGGSGGRRVWAEDVATLHEDVADIARDVGARSGGLPVVLAQTYRSIIHSRLGAGMERYKTAYPDIDIVLFEPNRADADMFFTNLFSYSSRRRLCEHAYQKTREELWKRRHELAPLFAAHGIEIRTEVLRDESMTLVKSLRKSRGIWRETASTAATRLLVHTLDDLERWLRLAAV